MDLNLSLQVAEFNPLATKSAIAQKAVRVQNWSKGHYCIQCQLTMWWIVEISFNIIKCIKENQIKRYENSAKNEAAPFW